MTRKTAHLTPEQAYELMVAALDLVGGVSPGVHARVRRNVKAGIPDSRPMVLPRDLVRLVDVLNRISPGIADRVIQEEATLRKERAVEGPGDRPLHGDVAAP